MNRAITLASIKWISRIYLRILLSRKDNQGVDEWINIPQIIRASLYLSKIEWNSWIFFLEEPINSYP